MSSGKSLLQTPQASNGKSSLLNSFDQLLQGGLNSDLNLNGYKVINSAMPTNSTDLASKAYVDQQIGGGGTLQPLSYISQNYPSTSYITMSDQQVKNVANGTSSNDAVNYSQLLTVDNKTLDQVSPPVADLSMNSYNINDLAGSYAPNSALTNAVADQKYISSNFPLNSINTLNELSGNIDLTITGNSGQYSILCDVPVTDPNQLVNKQYVDDNQVQLLPINQIALAYPTDNNTDMNFNRVINVSDGIDPLDCVNKTQLEQVITAYQIADTNLQTAVDDEILARQDADLLLQGNIDTVQDNIDAVQTNLNTEKSNRESADTAITLAYQNADLSLSTQITALQNTKATLGTSETGGDLYLASVPFTSIIPPTSQYHIYNVPYVDENGTDFERCQAVSCYQMQAFGYDKFYTKSQVDNIQSQLQTDVDGKMDNTKTLGQIAVDNLNDQNVNINSFQINNVLDGTALTDAINLSQLQAVETTQNLINTQLQTQIDGKYDNTLSLQDINLATPLVNTLNLDTGQEIHVPTITNFTNVKQAMNYETYTNLSKNPESLEITTTTLPTLNTKITGFSIQNQTTSSDNWITFDNINQTVTLKNQGTFLIIIRGRTSSSTNNNIMTIQLQNNTSGLEFKSGSSTIDFIGVLSNTSQGSQGQSIQILTKQGADVTLRLQCTALTAITGFQCDMMFIQIPSQYQTSQEIVPIVVTEQEYIQLVINSTPSLNNNITSAHITNVDSFLNGNITYTNGQISLLANAKYHVHLHMTGQNNATSGSQLQMTILDALNGNIPMLQSLYGVNYNSNRDSCVNLIAPTSNINQQSASASNDWIISPTSNMTLILQNTFQTNNQLIQSCIFFITVLQPNKVLSTTDAVSNLSSIVVDTNLNLLDTYKVTGCVNPTLSSDVVTKSYFDSNAVSSSILSNYYLNTTPLNSITQPTANVNMVNRTFINLLDPSGNQQPVTLNYLNNQNFYNSSNKQTNLPNSSGNAQIYYNSAQLRWKSNSLTQYLVNIDLGSQTYQSFYISEACYDNTTATNIYRYFNDSYNLFRKPIILGLTQANINSQTVTAGQQDSCLYIGNSSGKSNNLYIDANLSECYINCQRITLQSAVETTLTSTSSNISIQSSSLSTLKLQTNDAQQKIHCSLFSFNNVNNYLGKLNIDADNWTYGIDARSSSIRALNFIQYVPVSMRQFKKDITDVDISGLENISFHYFKWDVDKISVFSQSLASGLNSYDTFGIILENDFSNIPERYQLPIQNTPFRTINLNKLKDDMLQYLIVQNRQKAQQITELQQQVADLQQQITNIVQRLTAGGL